MPGTSGVDVLYLGVAVYGIALGTYLILRTDGKVFGTLLYLLVLMEVAWYLSQSVIFYILSVIVAFIGAMSVSYLCLYRYGKMTQYNAQRYSLLLGFGASNIVVCIIGLFTWIGLTSIGISLLAFEITLIGLGGDIP